MTDVATMVDVRRLTADDWTTLRDLRLAALRESAKAFLGDLAAESSFGERDWRLECRSSRWFVARIGGVPVGLGKLYRSDDPTESMHIESMWVEPASRRSGVASSLIVAMENTARDLGEDRLGLWVFQGNPVALAAYKHMGYHGPHRIQPLQVGMRTEVEEEYLKSLLPESEKEQ